MKSDSELMNELARTTNHLRELTVEESKLLKNELLAIFKDFEAVCQRSGLVYMMSGGTCLGAIRHEGFIPWDDDLDVMMPREDYDAFIRLCEEGVLGDEYEFDYPRKGKDAKTVFLKIFKRGTLNEEIYDDGAPFAKGIYIDVFALDAVPRNVIAQKVKGFFANALQFISIIVRYAQYPSRNLHDFMCLDKAMYRRYRVKVFFGKIFSIVPHRYWVYWFDRFVASSANKHPVGIPTCRKYYNGEIFEPVVYFPPRKAKFEGLDVYVPANYDAYLTNLYRNYMELPPIEKRERHFVCRFNVNSDNQ